MFVSQVTLSTPAVLPPLFDVTCLTAKALAENELIKMRWRAFTLPMRFAFRASTIRTCSLRTFFSHDTQSMVRHESGVAEDAHSVFTSFSCRFFILRRFYISFRSELPDGSLPTFVWDDVSIPIPTVTEGRSLSPSSFTHKPFGRTYD